MNSQNNTETNGENNQLEKTTVVETARAEVAAASQADTQVEKCRQELISKKIAAGLTKAQATHVVDAQIKHDAERAEETLKTASRTDTAEALKEEAAKSFARRDRIFPHIVLSNDEALSLSHLVETAQKNLALDEKDAAQRTEAGRILEKLEQEVAQLEKDFDGVDVAALEKLAAKRGQLSIMNTKIKALDDARVARADWKGAHPFSVRFHATLRPMIQQAIDAKIREITAILRPFFQTHNQAVDAAKQTICVLMFQNWLTYNLIDITNPRKSVERMMAVAQKILAQETVWTFNPYPNLKK